MIERLDMEIYLIHCPHSTFLYCEDREWCTECDEWIAGKEVGEMSARVEEDGTVVVRGSGYIPPEGNT